VFRHEGPARSTRKNSVLAGYLALVAGFVNSGGFILIGTFTSHVTGSVGRFSSDLARGDPAAASLAFVFVIAFFAGAFAASMIVETSIFQRTSRAYGVALLIETCLLGGFIFTAGLSRATHPRALDAEAILLCLAMGLQNSLVTRLSGAVVRTTHLTGIVTDLAIESARWYRWQRAKLHVPQLFPDRSPAVRPAPEKLMLLLTIVGAFTTGALLGAELTLRASRWAMLMPAAAILAACLYAFSESDDRVAVAKPTVPQPVSKA
jgi:uncharacterized membrane protein YoaK (UPF0700 family)